MDRKILPQLVADLYRIVDELESVFPGRHFTLDGHLVGSLGECLAAYHYGLNLRPASTKGVDADKSGVEVEIKATQGSSVGLRCQPEHLLVLKLDRRGGFEEIYNGPGNLVWREFAKKNRPSNGQYQIAISRLSALMKHVSPERRLKMEIPNA